MLLTATMAMIYNAIAVADNAMLHLISFCRRMSIEEKRNNKRSANEFYPHNRLALTFTPKAIIADFAIKQFFPLFPFDSIVHMVEHSPVWDAEKESNFQKSEEKNVIFFFFLNRIK